MNKVFVMIMVVVCGVLCGTHYASAEGETGWTTPLPVCGMGERSTDMGCFAYPDDMFTGMVLNPQCGTDEVGVLGCAYSVLKMAAATSGLPTPHGMAYVPHGVVGIADYGCAATDERIQYCANASIIYVGATMYHQYYAYSPVLPYVAVAHEYGHFLQQYYGIPAGTRMDTTRMLEMQADCYAGVLVQAYHTAGVLTDSDIEDIHGLYLQWGSDDHGSAEDRTNAFDTGYNNTQISVCDLINLFS